MTKPPILIFGVPRSGTTLLRTILNGHPHIASGPEAPWLANHARHNIMALLEALERDAMGYARNYDIPAAQVRDRVRLFIDGLMMDFAHRQGKERWAHKTPDDCLYVDFFTRVFPDAKYIHLLRNPLDTALSTNRIPPRRQGISQWHEENILLEPNCAVRNTLFNCALRWRRWNDKVTTHLQGFDARRVIYRAMVTEPERTFSELCEFIGEPFSPKMLELARNRSILPAWEWSSKEIRAARRITPDRLGRWKRELTADETRLLVSLAGGWEGIPVELAPAPACRLASAAEIDSPLFAGFMAGLNALAAPFGLRTFTDWSKVWEYPWLWFNGLAGRDLARTRVLDIGSEKSPMPWLLALLGASVTLTEADPQWVPLWESLRGQLRVNVDWQVTDSEVLPLPDNSVDVVTSFSVIEHQPDKRKALAEACRVLRPGGQLAVSFDICEPAMGMTFPEWNGRALTLEEFEREIWLHPAFGNRERPTWNLEDMPAFRAWHLRSAPHHNYVVGAAVLVKHG